MALLKEAIKLLLKNKKDAVGVIKEIKGGVSAITGVAPDVIKKERKIIADTLKEHRASESHKGYKEMMRKIKGQKK
jgi:hypothetical protein